MDLHNLFQSTSVPIEPDRRRHPRHTVNVQIEIHADGTDIPFRLETTDLSRGGCYVQLMQPFPTGQRLSAALWLDGSPMHLRGIVVTCHPNFGNGIMFVGFDGQSENLLNRYIDKLIGK